MTTPAEPGYTFKCGEPLRINDRLTGVFLSYIQRVLTHTSTKDKTDTMCRVLVDPTYFVRELHFLSRVHRRDIAEFSTQVPDPVTQILEKADHLAVITCFEFELKPLKH